MTHSFSYMAIVLAPAPRRAMTLGASLRGALLLGVLLLATAVPVTAQQCLGLTATARTRAGITQEASRSGSATSDRTRVMVALSRALALTASAVRSTYLDTEGMPWEARGPALQVSIEGPTDSEGSTDRARPYRLCPTIEFSGLRSNVANWGTPQEWKLSRFAPGIAAGWARALGPDLTLIPFASGTLVIESFEMLQPTTVRETRTFAVVEAGLGIVLYKVLMLRGSIPVPVGRREGYPGPYTTRTLSAGVVWSR